MNSDRSGGQVKERICMDGMVRRGFSRILLVRIPPVHGVEKGRPQAHRYSNDDFDATINRRASSPCDFRAQRAVHGEVLFEFSRRDTGRIRKSSGSFDGNLSITDEHLSRKMKNDRTGKCNSRIYLNIID